MARLKTFYKNGNYQLNFETARKFVDSLFLPEWLRKQNEVLKI